MAFWSSVASAGESANHDNALSLLATNRSERLAVVNRLLSERSMLITSLMQVIERPEEAQLRWVDEASPGNLAIGILGEMRAVEAIPLLVRHIAPGPDDFVSLDELAPSLAAMALMKIGKPAVPELVKSIGTNSDRQHRLSSIETIARIEGMEFTRVIIERALNSESQAQIKSRLQEVLEQVRAND